MLRSECWLSPSPAYYEGENHHPARPSEQVHRLSGYPFTHWAWLGLIDEACSCVSMFWSQTCKLFTHGDKVSKQDPWVAPKRRSRIPFHLKLKEGLDIECKEASWWDGNCVHFILEKSGIRRLKSTVFRLSLSQSQISLQCMYSKSQLPFPNFQNILRPVFPAGFALPFWQLHHTKVGRTVAKDAAKVRGFMTQYTCWIVWDNLISGIGFPGQFPARSN